MSAGQPVTVQVSDTGLHSLLQYKYQTYNGCTACQVSYWAAQPLTVTVSGTGCTTGALRQVHSLSASDIWLHSLSVSGIGRHSLSVLDRGLHSLSVSDIGLHSLSVSHRVEHCMHLLTTAATTVVTVSKTV